ncbi:MAG: UTP--glucose-1-phosphate uridylyltransferase GalU [Actinomycetota bacterium]|jgi:UTP--glucose-1-phosphate uridylyltransferase|nr:UTP--glucose-1-phosphate uridylyltransferase GalU [Actinomycetota bacterium]
MAQKVRKAVIPAAGLGTRFLPATKAQPKEMLPLVDKPAIQYVVEEAVSAGITDILVITGRGKRTLEDHFDRSFELEYYLEEGGKTEELAEMRRIAEMANIHYVRQGEPRGLGHAVSVAVEHVGEAPFAVLLGDDIMHPDAGVLKAMLGTFDERGHSVIALKEVPACDISSYGCAAVKPLEGNLVQVEDLIEKPAPEEAPSNLAVMGRYVFGPQIFDLLARTEPGRGGEIQLTDAIKVLAQREPVYGWTFRRGRFDVGNKLEYLEATVELALERDDLGPSFRKFLVERLARDDS